MPGSRGFTIVELLVGIAVTAVLMVSAGTFYLTFLQNAPVSKARTELAVSLQTTLERINDDVRQSSNVTTYNRIADPNAPTSVATQYADVPGPDTDPNFEYSWRMGEGRLLLNQTPISTSGQAIYENAQYGVGQKDTIIYYVEGDSLYRRVIAASGPGYEANSTSTATCLPRPATSTGGCTAFDTKVLSNLKNGAASFQLTYYDRNGNEIKNTTKDEDGNDAPDYSGFVFARSVGVKIELRANTTGSTQAVEASNSMRMQFRSQLNSVPPVVPTPPYVPPTNGITDPGVVVGAGGLHLSHVVNINGGGISVMGKVSLGNYSNIGSAASPINMNVGNVACGTGSTYPSPCGSSSQPISLSWMTMSSITGRVCAKDQTTDSGINSLVPSCTPGDMQTPVFNKAEFVGKMTNGTATGASASCLPAGSQTWAANRTYTDDISVGTYCRATIEGSMYIKGNLTIGAVATLRVSESAGTVRPIIVVNGRINLQDAAKIQPNSYGTAPYLISFHSTVASCSTSDSCVNITPSQLQASTNGSAGITTGIYTSASGSTFYSYFSGVSIGIASTVGAAAGQKITLDYYSKIMMNGGV